MENIIKDISEYFNTITGAATDSYRTLPAVQVGVHLANIARTTESQQVVDINYFIKVTHVDSGKFTRGYYSKNIEGLIGQGEYIEYDQLDSETLWRWIKGDADLQARELVNQFRTELTAEVEKKEEIVTEMPSWFYQ